MNTMTTERMTQMGMMPAAMMNAGMMMPSISMMPGMMGGQAGMMLPRCTMKMEKCPGGMKIMCECPDKTSAMMLQQLMMMNAGGMLGCCMTMNGMMVCNCCMPMGTCRYEMTEVGCTVTCTSGDAIAEKMIQACCDCMTSMMMPGSGCCCYMMMNNMPMCCCVC